MSLEYPEYPNWASMGVLPEPTRDVDGDYFDGMWFQLTTDHDFERRHQEWVDQLSPEHRAIYKDYLQAAREYSLAGEEELRQSLATRYEEFGLEYGVNTGDELATARNTADLFEMLHRVRLDAGGREANDQLEQFFRRQSET